MSKHTAGPWILETRKPTTDGVCVSWSIETATRVRLASAQSQEHLGADGIHESECLANARLIAAAPDLLEALSDALEFVEDQEDVVDGPYGEPVANTAMQLATALRAAIAKATGEAA